MDKQTAPQPEPNHIHRYLLYFEVAEKRYKADYVAAERRHPLGIMGGRIVQLLVWPEHEPGHMIMHYDHEWIKEPTDAAGRMALRKILERVR